jgi:uncharacterized protein YegJ (DUF2314 family)
MRFLLHAFITVLLALAAQSIVPACAQSQRDNVIGVPDNDPAMIAAAAKARASLPDFWRTFEKPGLNERGFSLKVEVPVRSDLSEFIWVQALQKRSDGKLTGQLANDPKNFKGKAGDPIEFGPEQIYDWMFMRNGKIVGNETMRPLLSRMPKELADQYRARLEKP